MPQSLFESYMHIVFSTKNRKPWLKEESIRKEMFSYLAGACNNRECHTLISGGHHEHVHILVRMGKKTLAPELIGQIKEDSSKWIKRKNNLYTDFFWQKGYGCFSLSATHVDRVHKYISGQNEHHKTISFKDEYRSLLKKNNVRYDEEYVWG